MQRQIVLTQEALAPALASAFPAAPTGLAPVELAALAWIALATVMLIATLIPYVRLARAVARLPRPAANDERLLLAQDQARAQRVARFELRLGHGSESFSLGLWRPIIVLPADLTPHAARAVLAHEMAHLARRDVWSGWLQTVVRSLFFMSPMVHVAGRRMAVLRELCCDSAAVTLGATTTTAFAALLVAQAEAQQGASLGPSAREAGPVAMALGTPSTLALRVQRLLQMPSPSLSTSGAMWLVAALIVATSSLRIATRDRYVAADACIYTPAFAQSLLASYPEADADSDGVLSKLEACDWQAGWRKDGSGPLEASDKVAALLTPGALCCNCNADAPTTDPQAPYLGSDSSLVPGQGVLFAGRPTC
ncbi:MAG: M56 family metallopeptidase [Myxococcales bacterium]|nr:M56 family metallopeptidase [Myxococcales bacterium]